MALCIHRDRQHPQLAVASGSLFAGRTASAGLYRPRIVRARKLLLVRVRSKPDWSGVTAIAWRAVAFPTCLEEKPPLGLHQILAGSSARLRSPHGGSHLGAKHQAMPWTACFVWTLQSVQCMCRLIGNLQMQVFSNKQTKKDQGPTDQLATTTSATFTNPVVNQDFPDPNCIKVEDTWYAFATNFGELQATTSHIQLATSKDLVNWKVLEPDDLAMCCSAMFICNIMSSQHAAPAACVRV